MGIVVASLVLPVLIPFGLAVAGAGEGTWSARAADWVRDHGGAALVDTVENAWYTLRAPSDASPPSSALPAPAGAPVAAGHGPATVLPVITGRPTLAGEARWYPGRPGRDGRPSLYTAWFRPDAAHAGVVVGVASLRTASLRFRLFTGTVQPVTGAAGPHAVDPSRDPGLVAIFNSGWRMADLHDGFFLDGRTYRPLVPGQASAVIDRQGRLTVGSWGREVGPGPGVVAVRQNLRLIVDGGTLAPGIDANPHQAWGSAKNQFQYTDRSALGVDRSGNVIYLAGRGLTLHTLAVALVDAGAVRGMELDIHSGLPMMSLWTPGPHGPVGRKLLPTMISPLDRYLRPEQRDFFDATLR